MELKSHKRKCITAQSQNNEKYIHAKCHSHRLYSFADVIKSHILSLTHTIVHHCHFFFYTARKLLEFVIANVYYCTFLSSCSREKNVGFVRPWNSSQKSHENAKECFSKQRRQEMSLGQRKIAEKDIKDMLSSREFGFQLSGIKGLSWGE